MNSDNAARCRRCGQSFANIDHGAESERLVASIQTRRIVIAAIVVILIAGLGVSGWMYKSRLDRITQYTERSRGVETDIVTLRRGAEADAALIARAFDDAEVQRLLRDQSQAWQDRVERCKVLGKQVDELVPQSEEQTSHEVGIERDLATITSASRGLADAAANSDPFSARVAAAKLAKPENAGDGAAAPSN